MNSGFEEFIRERQSTGVESIFRTRASSLLTRHQPRRQNVGPKPRSDDFCSLLLRGDSPEASVVSGPNEPKCKK